MSTDSTRQNKDGVGFNGSLWHFACVVDRTGSALLCFVSLWQSSFEPFPALASFGFWMSGANSGVVSPWTSCWLSRSAFLELVPLR